MEVPQTRYARAGDLRLAYQVFGDGPLELAFSGGPASHVELYWEHPKVARFYERLASFARVVIFDRRGTGLSDPVEGPPAFELHMEDLDAVIAAVGFERPALFASSEAGRMALLYAGTFPERVQALVLTGVAPVGSAVLRPEIRDGLLELIEDSWGSGGLVDFFMPSEAGDPATRRFMGRVERYSVSPGMARKLVEMSLESDIRAILPAVRVPTLVAHRRDDLMVPLELAREMAEALPEARLVVLEGSDSTAWAGDQDALLDEVEEFLTGERAHREPDRVLSTVLFTDIVGSTRRAAAVGDARWRATLEQHFNALRAILERHRGREVKTLGDGLVATFDGPARAVRAAREAVGAAAAIDTPIRAGVHTGEVELLGSDIAGMAVHIAARVSALAGSDEVLVSRTVRDLVVGSELRFHERGRHELEGIPGDWDLYAAVA